SVTLSTTLLSTLSLHDALPISGIAALHETRPEGGLDLPDRLSHRRLTEVRRPRRRAHTAAPDYLIEQHEMPQVRCRVWAVRGIRSEEHTSELQSHLNLVCRLLL